MTQDIKDGGPAFPHGPDYFMPLENGGIDAIGGATGMSLRDWFAGLAMKAVIASNPPVAKDLEQAIEILAVGSYEVADAMLKARGQS